MIRRSENEQGTIYVLHFEPAYEHAKHYIGYTTKGGEARADEHVGGRGSPLVRAATARGCTVTLAAEFPGTPTDERKLKNRKNARSICPRCRPDYNDECARRMKRLRANKKDRARRFGEYVKGARR